MPRKSRITLEQVEAQIAALQERARALRAAEGKEVLVRIKQAIEHYGFSAQDLGFGEKRAGVGRKASPSATKPRKKGIIRFRDEAGNSWTGVGKRPNWYKAAIAGGRTPEDLAVK
ncbi:MAG TPA: H-NS histone family protein [Methylibium sp.]|uniref:H-NS histone family protein n=1 Tax=Methylibium sp. TaxID=2067992 RepID=UPI002DC042B1|nr:H-NS histone family protein [Methylibium sp.]HEU4460949.1 H-NS histone family protein [Methylibium sp.]